MATDLINAVLAHLGSTELDAIGSKLGLNRDQTSGAVQSALPMIVSALAKGSTNAADKTNSLLSWLDSDGDGSIVDDLVGFVSSSNDSTGSSVAAKLFGSNQAPIQQHLGQTTGLSGTHITALIGILTPVVMGVLKRQSSASAQPLAKMLEQEHLSISQNSGTSSILSMLDRDGDGSAIDDMLSFGANLLGKR